MLLRRVSCETGDGGQTASPNVRRLVWFFIVVCLASAAGIPKLPSDAEEVPPVGSAEPWHQIKLEDAEDIDLLPRQPDSGTSFTNSEQGPQQKYFLPEEDAIIGDSDQDRPAAAAAGTGDASIDEDPNLRAAPKYMLELYRKFSNDKYSHPIANIVRSFLNINTGVLPIWTMGNRTRIALHTLLFNISSINRDEEVYLAELRLYAAKKTQRVLVYEVVHQSPAGTSADDENSPPSRRYQLLTTREIPLGHGDWETFSVTEVVRRWVRTQATAGHILEVRVDTARPENANGESEKDGGTAEEHATEEEQEEDKPIEQGQERNGAYEPILVVFSNDRKRRKIELRELHEIQSHENGMGDDEEASEYPSSPSSSTSYSSSTSSSLSGGEEEEEDYEDEEDPDGVRLNATITGGGGPEELDDEKSYPHLLESLSKSTDRVSTPSASKKLPRMKRSLNRSRRRRAKKNACRRKPMWVDFSDVQWDRWIIEPRGYQAYECTGQCYFPVGEHLTPTKYAMIKSLLHATYPKKIAAVCCVPTRLEPISLLYIDEHGTVTYKYKYDGMVVAECGCR